MGLILGYIECIIRVEQGKRGGGGTDGAMLVGKPADRLRTLNKGM